MQARLFFSKFRFVTIIGCLVAIAWLNAGALPVQAGITKVLTPVESTQQQYSDFVDFWATPGTLRGSIDLYWTYAGGAFPTTFLVERSINQTTWTPVAACSLSYSRLGDYSCTDSRLVSGRTYYYRICIPTLRSRTCPYGSTSYMAPAP